MTDYQKPDNTGEIVDELESIKSLLDEENAHSIPLLEEMIDDNAPIATTLGTQDSASIPTLDEPHHLPGQQGLFEEPPLVTQIQEEPPSEPSSNNPFLPKHIRERLGSSASYVQELEQQQRELEKQSLTTPFSLAVPSALDAPVNKDSAKTPIQQTIANPDKLIDSLVDQYLPIIEDDLRQQLKTLIDKSQK